MPARLTTRPLRRSGSKRTWKVFSAKGFYPETNDQPADPGRQQPSAPTSWRRRALEWAAGTLRLRKGQNDT
jgi:hypothetical protein